jgi:hypothetical protein
MEISSRLTGKKSNVPKSSVADTLVSLLVQLENGSEKKTRAICGHGFEKPLASYDPDTQSWKMFGAISLWEVSPSLVNLPPSGTTRNGVLFLRLPWEPITAETVSSSWPTPTTMDYLPARSEEALRRQMDNNRPGRTGAPTLKDAVGHPDRWPTPTARDFKGAAGFKNEKRNLSDLTYLAQVRSGTRTGQDGNGGSLNPTWVEWLMGFPPGWTDLKD